MRRALHLAERGFGRVQPNPMVGAVIVRDGQVVGEGWHELYGGPHAEINALRAAGDNSRGSTLYVTLEPCSHHGKTPPCTDAIIEAGIDRVVFASSDPNPVAAGGAEVLRSKGVLVESGILAAEAERLNAIFYHTHLHTVPFVTLKLALSLDGRIAERAGAPTALTGTEANAEVHRLRSGHDAIMIGVGTALADDPLLTARGGTIPRRPPVRVVLDSDLTIPSGGRLLGSLDQAPLLLLTSETADPDKSARLADAGATVVRVPASPSGTALDVHGILAALWEQGIQSVFCEGGARVAASLLGEDAVHRLTIFVAPRILGPQGVPAFDRAIPFDAALWTEPQAVTFGRDTAITFDRSGDPG